MELTPVQVRILGCLVEKERTTPDNYPLTMNSLLLACNQSTSRHPVVNYDNATVENALQNLRSADLIRVDHSRSNRADKYRQVLGPAIGVDDDELAVLSVLMLRGAQTAAELRARAERLQPFSDLDEVERVLSRLAARAGALVARLERAPGQKEARWVHLLRGKVSDEDLSAPESPAAAPKIDRVAVLEAAIEVLRAEVADLRGRFEELSVRVQAEQER